MDGHCHTSFRLTWAKNVPRIARGSQMLAPPQHGASWLSEPSNCDTPLQARKSKASTCESVPIAENRVTFSKFVLLFSLFHATHQNRSDSAVEIGSVQKRGTPPRNLKVERGVGTPTPPPSPHPPHVLSFLYCPLKIVLLFQNSCYFPHFSMLLAKTVPTRL
jgi:hypothetical protein